MICEPSEKDGRFLLNEVMQAGNFGHFDERMQALDVREGELTYQMTHAGRRIKRNIIYPTEVVWEPVARLAHYSWKRLHLWEY